MPNEHLMNMILRQSTLWFGMTALLVWMSLPGHCAEPGRTFLAYGASATAQELVAVRFALADGKLTSKIVQREPIGCEGAPVIFHERLRLLYVLSLRAQEDVRNQVVIFSVADDGRLTRQRQLPLKHGSAYASFDRR